LLEPIHLSVDLRRTGLNIARRREAMGISVRDLQIIFGFEYPQAIYNWQNGKCIPSTENLLILSRILKTTIEELLITTENTKMEICHTYTKQRGDPAALRYIWQFLNYNFIDTASATG
jgi:transcriptional regulator with XRE-family HTH domain